MYTNRRFICVDSDEIFYITDRKDLQKSIYDFRKEYGGDDEIGMVTWSEEDYRKYLIENSLNGKEVEMELNNLYEEKEHLRMLSNLYLEFIKSEGYKLDDIIKFYMELKENGRRNSD